jgi:hypothetical protein
MPAESGKLHAHIDPRNGHPTYFFLIILCNFEDGLGRLIYVVEIKAICSIIKILIHSLGSLKNWEARPILM